MSGRLSEKNIQQLLTHKSDIEKGDFTWVTKLDQDTQRTMLEVFANSDIYPFTELDLSTFFKLLDEEVWDDLIEETLNGKVNAIAKAALLLGYKVYRVQNQFHPRWGAMRIVSNSRSEDSLAINMKSMDSSMIDYVGEAGLPGKWEDWGYQDGPEYWDDDEYDRSEIKENVYNRMRDLIDSLEFVPSKEASTSQLMSPSFQLKF